ncbi:MAG: hypothetical protein ACRC0G_14105, partial [Fusobacteriaceae bacterium]
MNFEDLTDPSVKQDTSGIVSGQVSGFGEQIASNMKFGATSSASFITERKKNFNQVLSALGSDSAEEKVKEYEEEVEILKAIGLELQSQQVNYLNDFGKGRGVIEQGFIGLASGIPKAAINTPELVANIASGALVSAATTAVAPVIGASALTVAGIGFLGEVVENIGYNYYEKEHFLGQDFTFQDAKDTAVTTLMMAGTMKGLKMGVKKAFAPKVPKTVVENSVKIKGDDTTVSPKEFVEDYNKSKTKKEMTTGIDESQPIENAKTFDGKTIEEIE